MNSKHICGTAQRPVVSKTLSHTHMNVSEVNGLVDAMHDILQHDEQDGGFATLTIREEHAFGIIEGLNASPDVMFEYLQKYFAQFFDINLRIIAFKNGEYIMITRDDMHETRSACLVFGHNNKVLGPLLILFVYDMSHRYAKNSTGNRVAVFSSNDVVASVEMYFYMTSLNETARSTDEIGVQSHKAVYCVADCIEKLTSLSTDIARSSEQVQAIQTYTPSQFKVAADQFLQIFHHAIDILPVDIDVKDQICQDYVSQLLSNGHSSPQDIINMFNQLISFLKDFIERFKRQMNISDNQCELSQHNQAHQSIGDSLHVSTEFQRSLSQDQTLTMQKGSFSEENISIQNDYIGPEMKVDLKNLHHPRYLRDFRETICAPVRLVGSKQRAKISFQVPPPNDERLSITAQLLTEQSEVHRLKLLLPEGTQSNRDRAHIDGLKCLDFSKCTPSDICDIENRLIHFAITPDERKGLSKKVAIHVVNLYQHSLDAKWNENNQHKKFKIAFFYSRWQDNKYQRVSPKTYSCVIAESGSAVENRSKVSKKNIKRLQSTHLSQREKC